MIPFKNRKVLLYYDTLHTKLIKKNMRTQAEWKRISIKITRKCLFLTCFWNFLWFNIWQCQYLDCTVSDCRMTWIGEDLEGNSHGLMEPFWNLLEGLSKSTNTSVTISVSKPIVEVSTYRNTVTPIWLAWRFIKLWK